MQLIQGLLHHPERHNEQQGKRREKRPSATTTQTEPMTKLQQHSSNLWGGENTVVKHPLREDQQRQQSIGERKGQSNLGGKASAMKN